MRHTGTAPVSRVLAVLALAALPMFGQAAAEKPAVPPTAAEVQVMKEKVALATRMMTREGIVASSGHISMRIPGTDRVLVGPADVSRGIVSAEDVVTVDLNSNQLDGKRRKPSETEIHTGIYRARPDVMAVVHTHPVYSVAFTVTGKPILPVTMHGAIFADGVPVYDSVGHIDNKQRGDGLAETLGPRRAAMIKMHGAAITGKSLEEAFVAALQLEENAQVQSVAESMGKVTPMTPADVERCIRESFSAFSIQKRWQYYLDKNNEK
ncbi:MAG: class II aldolase/adducin family protein [Bryobacteraceae bacterium]